VAKKVVHDSVPASFNINITIKSSPDLLTYSCQATSNSGTYGPSSRLQMYQELWASKYRGCGLLRLGGYRSVEGIGKEEIRGDQRRGQQSGQGQTVCLQSYTLSMMTKDTVSRQEPEGTVRPAMAGNQGTVVSYRTHSHGRRSASPQPLCKLKFSEAEGLA
jgi:hypothetical protein